MSNKINVMILIGGQSAEHEVSLQSGRNVFNAIDALKYERLLVGITRKGEWYLLPSNNWLTNPDNPKTIKLNTISARRLSITPGEAVPFNVHSGVSFEPLGAVDVIFPVVHGTLCEDGALQGLLKTIGIPFVGAQIIGSSIGMDKDISKRLLRDAGLPVGKFTTLSKGEKKNFEELSSILGGAPFFVKPANSGSSVGVHKVTGPDDLNDALKDAFLYDHKVIVEEAIIGREIECSVIGNNSPRVSLPGEVRSNYDFYSYEAKYLDEKGASLEIPAKIPLESIAQIQELAISTFKTLQCKGMARVDFFFKNNGEVLINEINTIPGFTRISMYPKLWETSGLSYGSLIDELISLALEQYNEDKKLRTSFPR